MGLLLPHSAVQIG